MRWWRCEVVGVGGLKAAAWLGLLLGGALTFTGCATSSTIRADAADAYVSAARMSAERTEREGDGTKAAVHQAPAEPSEPANGNSSSGRGGPLSALLSGLWGTPTHLLSATEEEALIAHAIAEHEMRNP